MKKLITIISLIIIVCATNVSQSTCIQTYNIRLPKAQECWQETFLKCNQDINKAKYEKRIEDEKAFHEAEAARKAEEERRRIEQELAPVNFDAVFNYVDTDMSSAQYWVDLDYLTRAEGDWYHHNTSTFMNLFNRLAPGKQVILGGQTYTCLYVETGSLTADRIWCYGDSSGMQTRDNGTTEIITCKGSGYTLARYIAHLQ